MILEHGKQVEIQTRLGTVRIASADLPGGPEVTIEVSRLPDGVSLEHYGAPNQYLVVTLTK